MQNNTFETLVGALVIAVAAGFLFFAYSSTHAGSMNGYDVKASFSSADGITDGADVRLHGIKVGSVSSIDLDPATFDAIVHLSIRDDVKIPDDSSVKVISSLLGGNSYLSIQPGGSDKMLLAGATISNTQGSIDLMGLIGRVIYGNSGSK
jgi:phospholipid/cholesterol/gamma-HCH transport system substrate-binding protein